MMTLEALSQALRRYRSEGTIENSPAFQCRVLRPNASSPEGTAETAEANFRRPSGTRDAFPCSPALKRRAIVVSSRWDDGRHPNAGCANRARLDCPYRANDFGRWILRALPSATMVEAFGLNFVAGRQHRCGKKRTIYRSSSSVNSSFVILSSLVLSHSSLPPCSRAS